MALAGMTGITSAIGMCVETTWRTTPTTGAGPTGVVIGVASTNPHRFRIVDPGGGIMPKPTIVAPNDEVDGDPQLARTLLTDKAYQGSYTLKGDGENLFEPLLGIFGKSIQTQVAGAASTSITPCFKKVFTPNKYAPAFTVEEIFGDANYGRVTGGTVIDELDLTFGPILEARMNLIGYRQVPNSYSSVDYDFGSANNLIPSTMGGDGTKQWLRTAAPTYIDVAQLNNGNGPFVWGGLGFGTAAGFSAAYLTVDDVAKTVNILPGIKLNIKRIVQSFLTAGSGFDPGACVGNQIEVAGDISLLFQDNTIPLAALRHSKIGINFLISGIYIGSAAQKYSIEVYIPNAKFTAPQLSVPGAAMVVGGQFVARKDPTLGYAAQITLINSYDQTNLIGVAGTTGAAGGLGGWNDASR